MANQAKIPEKIENKTGGEKNIFLSPKNKRIRELK